MDQTTMSNTRKPTSTSFDANVCPFCNKALRGDPRICPNCKGTLRFSTPWWDLSGGLGQKVIGSGVVCLFMVFFGIYSGWMSYQTQIQPEVSHKYMIGAITGGVGALVFALIALRSYKLG